MGTSPVDYAALAKQAGAIASSPAGVDYAALAKQAGALQSHPAATVPDAGAQMLARAKAAGDAMIRQENVTVPVHPYGGAPVLTRPVSQDLVDMPGRGLVTAAQGVEQMASPGLTNKAGAAHKILSGAMQAASPLLLPAALSNPLTTAATLALGMAGGKLTETGARALGLPEEWVGLSSDVVSLLVGHKTGQGIESLKETGGPFMVPDPNPAIVPRTVQAVAKLPGALSGAVSGALKSPLSITPNLDPAEASSVRYAQEQNIPLPTSVLTGSKVAANAENIAQNLPLMAGVAKTARAASQTALQSAGAGEVDALAPPGGAGGTVPQPLDAGEAINRAAIAKERAHSESANQAYDVFRSIEAQPEHAREVQTGTRRVQVTDENGNVTTKTEPVLETVQLPVDYRPLKAAVKPLLAEVLKPMSIAQEESSTGIKALRNILDAPDFVSASTADQDLGALKGIMRDSAQSRSVGQAKFAADRLSRAVDEAANRAGPDAVAALEQGRAATVAKYKVQDFQKDLGFTDVGTGRSTPGEAVPLVDKIIRDEDRSIGLLRQVAEHAPEHVPALAQAKLQQLIEAGTRDAGMDAPKAALRKWINLGAETKQILYGDRAQPITDWFTLNKRLADNPNPSGSGSLLAMVKGVGLVLTQPHIGVPVMLGAKPLARMLFNPAESRLMMAAIKTPATAPGASILARQVLAAAGPGGVTPVPATPGGGVTAAPNRAQAGSANYGNPQQTGTSQTSALPVATRASQTAGTRAPGGTIGSRYTFIPIPGKPGGGGYKAEYRVQELADLQASHNGMTFQANPKYKALNDRNYASAVNQGKIIAGASRVEFDPSLHITDNADMTNGPLAVDSEGQVLGGNGRKMMLDRVYATNPAGAAKYRALLESKAAQFGIDPAEFADMKQPVLTRVIADSELAGVNARQEAITDFNKVGTAPLTPAEQAIADSRRVSDGTLDHIGARLESLGADATLAQVLDGKAGGEVLNRLVDDGVISPQQRGAFVDDDGELHKAGKDKIEALIVGRFFRDPSQLESISPLVKNQVVRIAAPLAQVDAKPDWTLTPAVKDAVTILERAQKLKLGVDDFLKQDGLFGESKYSPESVDLARALKTAPAEVLKSAARQYVGDAAFASQGNALFGGGASPASAFADAFGPEAIAKRIEEVKAAREAANKPKPANSLSK